MSGRMSYYAGLSAEDQIARAYEASGHPVSARRWRGTGGEIDIVARDGDGLIFVEVKKARDFARAAERVTRRQMRRICDAAAEFLGTQPLGQLTPVRFDVALVNGRGEIDVIRNAFGV